MVILTSSILCHSRRSPMGIVILRVVVIEHHDDRAGLRRDQTRLFPPLCLAVEIPHRAGVAPSEPFIEPITVCGGSRVGDPTCKESQLESSFFYLRRQSHDRAADTATGGSGGTLLGVSATIRRAPRP